MINEVIDRLAEIESAAVGITENTGIRKLQIAQESEAEFEKYDKKIQRSVNNKIEKMKRNFDEERQQKIQRMQEKSIRDIRRLEEEYQKNHTKLARDILNTLTRV